MPSPRPATRLAGSTQRGGRFCPMGGGIPLTDGEGQVFAGVGVSGGTADEDVAIVEAAVRQAT